MVTRFLWANARLQPLTDLGVVLFGLPVEQQGE
ncbi:Uncharacterised protein [Vibrio cholerae]|nr:Uncharacterised protein [Vibrio cholerae]